MVASTFEIGPRFPGRNLFGVFSLLALWWLVFASLAYLSDDLPDRMFWGQMAWLGIVGTPVSWALFVWAYTSGRDLPFTNVIVLLSAVFVAAIWLLAMTNDLHHLIYTAASYHRSSDGSDEKFLVLSYGIGWKLSLAICYATFFAAIVLLARAILGSVGVYRSQYFGLLSVAIIPGAVNVAYLSSPVFFRSFDPTPFCFLVGAGIFYMQIRYRQLFSLLPIATDTLLDAVDNPVLVIDRRGIVVHANRPVQAMPGVPSDIVGSEIRSLPPVENFLGRRSNGSIGGNDVDLGDRSYEVYKTPLLYAEREVGTLLVFHDVTQRKIFEEKILDANLRAEEALDMQRQVLREQRDLLSMIAHEFRTPMAVIDSAIQLIGDYDRRDEVGAEIEKINRAVRRMAQLISTCLAEDWLRTPGARLLRLNEVDLVKMVEEVCDEVHIQASGRVVFHLSEPILVSCDSSMMRIAVTNLIDNALKYSQQDKLVDVWVRRDGDEARIEVADRGAGVASDEREKIFGKYYRSLRTTETIGAGLGLYLVRGIVSMHHGRTWVESREGGGAIFSISLQIIQKPNQTIRKLSGVPF